MKLFRDLICLISFTVFWLLFIHSCSEDAARQNLQQRLAVEMQYRSQVFLAVELSRTQKQRSVTIIHPTDPYRAIMIINGYVAVYQPQDKTWLVNAQILQPE